MKNALLLPFLLCSICSFASNVREELAVGLIADSLTRKANSVIRSSDVTLEIKSPSQAEYTCHKVITILNEKAADELSIQLVYNSFQKISAMTASVYDKNGKLMNKHNKGDMTDYAYLNGFSLYEDTRIRYIRISGGEYPVTIDYSYTYEYKGILDYPEWWLQGAHQSIENSGLTVKVPADMGINYKAYNIKIEPTQSNSNDMIIYQWVVKNRKVPSLPGSSYSRDYFLPHVDLSPKKFEIAGYKGSLDSWKEFGNALSGAYHEKRKLTDKTVREIKERVKNAHSDREKAEILYAYLQNNFRYVSIDIGFGGYIPFSAGMVDSTKYGDCKALSNYMCAMLNTLNITAYPVLINAGANLHPIDTSFPSNKFNHCILYAEIDKKPTWLECTSTSLPFGELSTFTENRYGVMLMENGGKIINTPASDASLNTETLSHEVTLTGNYGAEISGSLSLAGEYRPAAKSKLIQGSKKDQESYLFNTLNIRQYENPELINARDSAAMIRTSIKAGITKAYDFKTDAKYFLPSTYIKQWYENINVDSNRKHDLILGFPAITKEKLSYILPDSQKVSLPADYDLDNEVIMFHRKSTNESDHRVTVESTYTQKKYIIHGAEIALLKESLQKINKYIQQKVIIEKIK